MLSSYFFMKTFTDIMYSIYTTHVLPKVNLITDDIVCCTLHYVQSAKIKSNARCECVSCVYCGGNQCLRHFI